MSPCVTRDQAPVTGMSVPVAPHTQASGLKTKRNGAEGASSSHVSRVTFHVFPLPASRFPLQSALRADDVVIHPQSESWGAGENFPNLSNLFGCLVAAQQLADHHRGAVKAMPNLSEGGNAVGGRFDCNLSPDFDQSPPFAGAG